MIYRSGPVNKADGNYEKPPAAGFAENLAPEHEASSNPSREPLSHELAKWCLLEACSARAQLHRWHNLQMEGQMVPMVVVDPGSLHSEHMLQQMPGSAAPGTVEHMLLGCPSCQEGHLFPLCHLLPFSVHLALTCICSDGTQSLCPPPPASMRLVY